MSRRKGFDLQKRHIKLRPQNFKLKNDNNNDKTMKAYLDLLQKILTEGVEKESGRANMPNTIGISKADIQCNLQDGFPLLTTKKMYLKGIIHELLWFLRGETNIKYLVDNNVNIWNKDAYRWYLKHFEHQADCLSYEEFIQAIKSGEKHKSPIHEQYHYGDLGKVYGYQWRNQNGVDQVADVVKGLQENPFSRYHIIDGWNKADFKDMALPPCHLLYQFIVRPIEGQGMKFYLDLNMYQRSCDTFLGVPFNIASASLLLKIMANVAGMEEGVFNWIGGDTHIYVNHVDAVKEQLSRTEKTLPQLKLKKDLKTLEDIENLEYEDFELIGYNPDPAIKAELSVGL